MPPEAQEQQAGGGQNFADLFRQTFDNLIALENVVANAAGPEAAAGIKQAQQGLQAAVSAIQGAQQGGQPQGGVGVTTPEAGAGSARPV